MAYCLTIPTEESMFKQIASELSLRTATQQDALRKHLSKKYLQHLSLLHYNSIREQRFISRQKKTLQHEEQATTESKKAVLDRLEHAINNKRHSLGERTKRVENTLQQWQRTVQRNREQYLNRVNESPSKIKRWSERLSASSERKHLILSQISSAFREKSDLRESRSLSSKQLLAREQQERIINFEKREKSQKGRSRVHYNSRISTRGKSNTEEEKKEIDQSKLEKSLLKTIDKQQRINNARNQKIALQEKRKQQWEVKERNRILRLEHLNSIQQRMERRNEVLQKKFSKKKAEMSLPAIKITHSLPPINPERKASIYKPTYNRIIMEKLRNMSLLMRQK